MPSNRSAGQASAEYVAVLLVIATLLAGAAALAIAVPGVGERLVETVRTGLCIVGGDVCRTSDARAAGLHPCVTEARSERQDTTIDIAVVRLGEHGEWQIALQSDGGALVTRLDEREIGGTVGVGATFSPAGVEAAATGSLVVGYRGGRAWRFADPGAAGAFLERAMRDRTVRDARPPDVRWDAIGGGAEGSAGVAVGQLASAGLTTGADGAVGLRTEGAHRTLTLELGHDGLRFAAELPGVPAGGGERRTVMADVTWEAGEARELALRTANASGDRVEELTARIDLREPEGRMLAERLLRPGSTSEDLRALARHAARHGVVERHGYATTEHRRGLSLAGRLGVSLGLTHHRITAERRLVDAVAWIRGAPPRRRLDCLGV